jgi:uncharacterized protein YndB with AHSA1/START domain
VALNKLVNTFEVDEESNSITITREFRADIPRVWKAWTSAEILDMWWAPKPWKSKTKSMDFKSGGYRHYAMCGPEGEEHWGLTKFSTVQEFVEFTGSDCFADADADVNVNEALPVATFKVSFKSAGETTIVTNQATYAHVDQLTATLEMGFEDGITMAMEGLDEVLHRGLDQK